MIDKGQISNMDTLNVKLKLENDQLKTTINQLKEQHYAENDVKRKIIAPCIFFGKDQGTSELTCLICGIKYKWGEDFPRCGAPAKITGLTEQNTRLFELAQQAINVASYVNDEKLVSHIRPDEPTWP